MTMPVYSSSLSVLLTWMALPATWAWPWSIARQWQLRLIDNCWQATPDYCHPDTGN